MDAAIGALVAELQALGAYNNTLLWYTADNGPFPGKPGVDGGLRDVHSATNGLRQCKGSVFEGGIRVPGFVHWPGKISTNAHTSVPAYVPDVLPTLLSLWGLEHPHPEFAADGTSLIPLLLGNASWVRPTPLAWQLGTQIALLDALGQFKVVIKPGAGLCPMENSSYLPRNASGPYLFDVIADPTESEPLNDAQPARLAAMATAARAWSASIGVSQVNESECLPGGGGGSVVKLQFNGSKCLAADSLSYHASVSASAPCDATGGLASWTLAPDGELALVNNSYCFHSLKQACSRGSVSAGGLASCTNAETDPVLRAGHRHWHGLPI